MKKKRRSMLQLQASATLILILIAWCGETHEIDLDQYAVAAAELPYRVHDGHHRGLTRLDD